MLGRIFTPHLYLLLPLFVSSIRIADIDVPLYHLSGKDLQLNCTYKHESDNNDPLYSVKWYRGVDHFYEFVPTRIPQLKSFPFPGLKVNLNRSIKSSVVLNQVSEKTSGIFRCEVMADKPSFETDSASANMTVVEPPLWGPEIYGVKHNSQVRIGDLINIQCSVSESRPQTNLTWILNGRRFAVAKKLTHLQRTDPYVRQILETKLDLRLERSSFIKGTLHIECLAEVYNVWRRSCKIILLDINRPTPAGIGWWFSSGCKASSTTSVSLQVIVLVFLWPFRGIE